MAAANGHASACAENGDAGESGAQAVPADVEQPAPPAALSVEAEKPEFGVPKDMTYWKLFKLFLRFGCLAVGGPVRRGAARGVGLRSPARALTRPPWRAPQVQQIAMVKEELVTQGKWISPQEFNKARAAAAARHATQRAPRCWPHGSAPAPPRRAQVFAVYQALPGPEATELCCYFGQIAKGRLGGLIGGLCFCAPGAHCAALPPGGAAAAASCRQRNCGAFALRCGFSGLFYSPRAF